MNLADAAALVARFAGNPKFERSCHGKRQHQCEEEAKRHAKLLHKAKKKKYDAYACPFCHAWHVGSRLKPHPQS